MEVDGVFARCLSALLPARCALCQRSLRDGAICACCEQALPAIASPCRGCAMPLADAGPELCADCQQTRPPPFDRAWAAFRLATPIQGLIHGLKYSAQLGAAHLLGELAARRLAQRPEPLPQLLIPVPLHASRLRRRGYNQALELAKAMRRVLEVPLAPRAICRVRATADQIGQSAAQRRKNLKGAFEARGPLRGMHLALLDDVMTTGATLAELAHVCRKAGATKVEAWAIARAT